MYKTVSSIDLKAKNSNLDYNQLSNQQTPSSVEFGVRFLEFTVFSQKQSPKKKNHKFDTLIFLLISFFFPIKESS